MFLNRGSAEPWGSVGIPQGFRRDTQWFREIFILSIFPHLLVNFTWKDSSLGQYAITFNETQSN